MIYSYLDINNMNKNEIRQIIKSEYPSEYKHEFDYSYTDKLRIILNKLQIKYNPDVDVYDVQHSSVNYSDVFQLLTQRRIEKNMDVVYVDGKKVITPHYDKKQEDKKQDDNEKRVAKENRVAKQTKKMNDLGLSYKNQTLSQFDSNDDIPERLLYEEHQHVGNQFNTNILKNADVVYTLYDNDSVYITGMKNKNELFKFMSSNNLATNADSKKSYDNQTPTKQGYFIKCETSTFTKIDV